MTRRSTGPDYCSEAAVALWLGQSAEQLEDATRAALADQPARQAADPYKAEKRRLTWLLEGTEARLSRLLDAYTDVEAGLNLGEYKSRRATIEQAAAEARARL